MTADWPFQNPELPLEARLADLLTRLTVEEKLSLLPTRQAAIPRLGISAFAVGGEGAHGFVDRNGVSTAFPQTQGLASSWDRDLLRAVGRTIGREARARYNANGRGWGIALWFPTVDMERNPLWGRTEEAYGEDPFLTGELSAEIVAGAQGDDPTYAQVSCAPKHFFANNNEADRATCSCSVDPRNLREYYLAAFKPAFVKGKALSLMTAYNEVNGVPLMLHSLVRDAVKGEWGLDGRGHVVTDGGDFIPTVTQHRYFETHAETLAAAFHAGVDTMTDDPATVIAAGREALGRGLITEADLDSHVGAALRVRFRYGQFDPVGRCPYDRLGPETLASPEHAALARRAVAESVVLLKNAPAPVMPATGMTAAQAVPAAPAAPLLPLAGDLKTLAVIGPLADVSYADWYAGNPPYTVTPLAGLRAALPNTEILHEDARDVVSFATADGRPLWLDEAATLRVGSTDAGPGGTGPDRGTAARFIRDDWGWGASTLISESTGKYLQTKFSLETDHQLGADEHDRVKKLPVDAPVQATADSTLSWFLTTLFNIVGEGDDRCQIKSWTSLPLEPPAADGPVGVKPVPEDPASFRMRVERDGIARAVEAARRAAVALVFVGNNPMINGKEEVDRCDLALCDYQRRLIAAVAAANPRTVVVIVSGYPVAFDPDLAPAWVYAAHGLQEFGHGLADALTGKTPPAGRLTMTWYRSARDLPPMMEYDIISSKTTYQYFEGPTLFPFGHGLTYSPFAYSDIEVASTSPGSNPPVLAAEAPVTVSFTLENQGSIESDEVPQLYVSVRGSRVPRPIRSLKGFDRLHLGPGERRRVSFALSADDLAAWDVTRGRFCVESGSCEVSVGPSSGDLRLSVTVPVRGETIPPRDLSRETHAEDYDAYRDCYLGEKRGSDVPAVYNRADGAWLCYRDADFGSGARAFTACVSASAAARIEVRVGACDGPLVATLEPPHTGDTSQVPGRKTRRGWATVSVALPAADVGSASGESTVSGQPGVPSAVRGQQAALVGRADLYLVLYGALALHTFSIA